MKRLLKLMICVFAIIAMILPIHADSVDLSQQTGYIYNFPNQADKKDRKLAFKFYQGRPAYCVEPAVAVAKGGCLCADGCIRLVWHVGL